MPQEPLTLKMPDFLLVHWYQWEFLRRNPEYQRDYGKLATKFSNWFRKNGFWYERNKAWTKRKQDFFYRRICQHLNQICLKWQITDPFPPNWSFDSLGMHEYAPGFREYLPTDCGPNTAAVLWQCGSDGLAHRSFRGIEKNGEKKSPRYLNITLDVTRPQKSILKEVLKAIQFQRKKFPAL